MRKLTKLTVFLMFGLILSSYFSYGQVDQKIVFAFYYPWYEYTTDQYGYPEEVTHWDQWKEVIDSSCTEQVIPFSDSEKFLRMYNLDFGTTFYPDLEPYSSNNSSIMNQHIQWMKNVGVDVIIISWWGPDSNTDDCVGDILDKAAAKSMKVCFLLEPYNSSAVSVGRYLSDISYIYTNYGNHPAFFKVKRNTYGNPNGSLQERGVFFIWRSDAFPQSDWINVLDPNGSLPVNIRGTSNDAIIIQKVDGSGDFWRISNYYFDGLYTYKGDTLLNTTSFNTLISQVENLNNSIFCLGISPGYDDTGHKKDSCVTPLPRVIGGVNTYSSNWNYAISSANPSWTAIVTFNEWHEGTQIEPARYNPPDPAIREEDGFPPYQTYEGIYGQTGTNSETAYITGEAVLKPQNFKTSSTGLPGWPTLYNTVDFSSLRLSWESVNANPSVSNYRVQIVRKIDAVVVVDTIINNVTSYQVGAGVLSANTEYNWSVKALNSQGWGDFSPFIVFETPDAASPPQKIKPINCEFTNTLSPVFTWYEASAIPPVTNYQIQVTNSSGSPIFTSPTISGTSYTLPSGILSFNYEYKWRIRSYNQLGWGVWSGLDCFRAPQTPYAPTLTYPIGGTTTGRTPTLQWQPVTVTPAVDYYHVQVLRAVDNVIVYENNRVGGTSQQIPAGILTATTTYKWWVRAHNSKAWGPWSDFKRFNTR